MPRFDRRGRPSGVTSVRIKPESRAPSAAPDLPERVRRWPMTKLLDALSGWIAALTVIAVAVAIAAFWFDYQSRQEERAARQEERDFRRLAQIATAWEVLLTPVGGDIGKGNALNTLVAAGQVIDDADFSCRAVGTFRDGKCVTRPQFNGVRFGEGDFWVTDEGKLHDGGMDFFLLPYVRDVNFEDAVISDFTAENLFINEGFRNVTGRNWLVRGASTFGFKLDLGTFTCRDCAFYESHLSWNILKSLVKFTLTDGVVFMPIKERDLIERLFERVSQPGRFRGLVAEKHPPLILEGYNSNFAQTHLEAPALFLWAEDDHVIIENFGPLNIGARQQWLPIIPFETFDDALFWPMYREMSYCLNRQDYSKLRVHIRDLENKRQAEYEAENAAREKAGRLVYHFSNRLTHDEWGEGYTQPYQVPQRQSLEDAFKAPPVKQYKCNFDFEEVEPLLRKRLLAQAERHFGR